MNLHKRKICFVSLFAYPLFDKNSKVVFGGSEVQLVNLAKELSKDIKNDVTFIVGDLSKDIPSESLFNGIKIFKIFNLSKNNLIYEILYSVRLFYYVIKINSDVYIKRSAGPEAGIVAMYCMIFKKKFIYMTASETDCNGAYRRKSWFSGLLYEFGLKNAVLVITQSDDHRKLLKKKYNINAVVLKSAHIIPEKNTEQKLDFILWVSRLDELKQPEKFIEVAEKFPYEKFIMIAPDSLDKTYAEKIKGDALKKGIAFIPGLPFIEIDEYFKNAKLFVNTSRYEGFPNTFVQAAMHGTPIISLNINPDNVLNKYRIGFFANNNFPKLIESMSEVLVDRDVYREISNNAYNYASSNHDIKIVSKEFSALINKVY